LQIWSRISISGSFIKALATAMQSRLLSPGGAASSTTSSLFHSPPLHIGHPAMPERSRPAKGN
jgi:hypothetical protein